MRTCDRMRSFIRPHKCDDLMTVRRYGDAQRRVQIRFKSLQLSVRNYSGTLTPTNGCDTYTTHRNLFNILK